jgi:hypothetical protein
VEPEVGIEPTTYRVGDALPGGYDEFLGCIGALIHARHGSRERPIRAAVSRIWQGALLGSHIITTYAWKDSTPRRASARSTRIKSKSEAWILRCHSTSA